MDSDQPTDPMQTCALDGDDAAATPAKKLVKVFILLGQSNMVGMGKVLPMAKKGTLMNLVFEEGKYQHLVDDCPAEPGDKPKWTTLDNVRYVRVMDGKDKMKVLHNEFLTVQEKQKHFGPELGFGHVLGPWMKEKQRQQEQDGEQDDDSNIMLLKSCIGNRSLGWDLLPPGSQRYEFGEKIFAGYKDDPASWSKDPNIPPKPSKVWYAGKQYDIDIQNCKNVLSNIGDYYPGATDYEVAGFVWWQGHKDHFSAAHTWRYEQNLAHLINTLRDEFHAPQAKFVCATVGFGGYDMKPKSSLMKILNAQLAVSEDSDKYPEFQGNVKTIDSRPYYRKPKDSPMKQGHHYHQNAETFYEVGRALGEAMVELFEKQPVTIQ